MKGDLCCACYLRRDIFPALDDYYSSSDTSSEEKGYGFTFEASLYSQSSDDEEKNHNAELTKKIQVNFQRKLASSYVRPHHQATMI
jgi:hypothetical protein